MGQQSERAIAIGLDGGGTHTRALVTDLTGRPLAFAETGGSSPQHNADADAEANVRKAITQAIKTAEREPSDVVCLVAGLAGLDEEADKIWAERYTEVPDLNCPRIHVNDAVIAHAGALCNRPGIILVAGTGAITYGVTETGHVIRNYDFNHYADSAGRTLAYNAIYQLLIEETVGADDGLIQNILAFCKVSDIAQLRVKVMEMSSQGWKQRIHYYGSMAPLVTDAAMAGSPLARRVCDRAIDEMAISIRLIGHCFTSEVVQVALIGSVARSPYMQQTLAGYLSAKCEHTYQVISSALTPEAGAVLIALQQVGLPAGEEVQNALKQYGGAQ